MDQQLFDHCVPAIVLLKGDSEQRPMSLPLEKLGVILMSDMEEAWNETGTPPYKWTVASIARHGRRRFNALYEIQSFVAFEYECHHYEVADLLAQALRAISQVQSEEATRALSLIVSVARRQCELRQGISFKPTRIQPAAVLMATFQSI